MKKLLIMALCLLCLFTVACGKKEEKKDEDKTIVGGWETVLASQDKNMQEDVVNYFNDAKGTYAGLNLDLVALLGKQVVAGNNYMYLAKGYQPGEEAKATYKVVIVYHDLEGKNTITKVNDFDYIKYVNENIDANNEEVTGGWEVESSGRPYTIFEESEYTFYDKATETLTGMNFKPVALLGKQLVAGNNYAVLCYGAATVPDAKENVYVLTIYEDLQGNAEVTGIAYVDLSVFNK